MRQRRRLQATRTMLRAKTTASSLASVLKPLSNSLDHSLRDHAAPEGRHKIEPLGALLNSARELLRFFDADFQRSLVVGRLRNSLAKPIGNRNPRHFVVH